MLSDRLRHVLDTALAVGEYSANAVVGLFDARLRVSGATPAEEVEPLPGDHLVPWETWQATRAVTVDAPPAEVWPWLAQAGYGRGGWYADMAWWRDAQGRRGVRSSSDHLLPDQQTIEVGQVLLDGPGCDETKGAWTVCACEPEHTLVLYSSRTFGGREVVPGSSPPRVYFDCSWAFVLRPVPEGTRMLVRTRVRLHPQAGPFRWLAAAFGAGDTAMQRGMLLGIKRRVENGNPALQGVTTLKGKR